MKILSLFFLLLTTSLFASKEHVIWCSLDPASLQQKLLFYRIFPESDYIKPYFPATEATLKWANVFTRDLPSPICPFTEEELQQIEAIHASLPHRLLLGHHVEKEEDLFSLSPEQIDLARALLLLEYPENLLIVRSYEVLLDTLAQEVFQHLPATATPSQKVDALNQLLFEKEGFCFPPNSLFSQAIDRYTHLSSVLDYKKGVCLGVSVLYLCLAQRMDLNLEVVTPPGHIYLRCGTRNIETTARGFHVCSEHYLSPNTCALQTRTLKEIIGLVWMNHASLFLQNREYTRAVLYYEKAKKFLPQDPFLEELLGFSLILSGRQQEGHALLSAISATPPPHFLYPSPIVKEYLEGNVDASGIALLFEDPPKDRAGWLRKKERFEILLREFPNFTTGWRYLADIWTHLHRPKETLYALEQARQKNPKDPDTLFALTSLYAAKRDFLKAWETFHQLQDLLQGRTHFQRELFSLQCSLRRQFAEVAI